MILPTLLPSSGKTMRLVDFHTVLDVVNKMNT